MGRTSAASKNKWAKKNLKRFETKIKPALNDKILKILDKEKMSRPKFLSWAVKTYEQIHGEVKVASEEDEE